MKKIITFLLAAGSITFAAAQSSRQSGEAAPKIDKPQKEVVAAPRTTDADDSRITPYKGSGSNFSSRDRDEEIQSIKRSYEEKIATVKRAKRMRASEKGAQVRMLEKERDQRIRQVEARYYASSKQNNNTYPKGGSQQGKW